MPVAFSPVLCAKDSSGGCNGTQKHILYELDLSCQGNGGHFVLGNPAKHQCVARRYQRKHQALQCDRQRKPDQIFIENFLVDDRFHGNLLCFLIFRLSYHGKLLLARFGGVLQIEHIFWYNAYTGVEPYE